MSDPKFTDIPDMSRLAKVILRTLIGGLLVFVLLGLFAGEVSLIFDFVFTLLLGWWNYLTRVLPRIQFNLEIALCAVVALTLATLGLHRILRWWRTARENSETWQAGWTLRITAMLLLLFATSIAATGIVHQVGWLFRTDGLVYNAGIGRITGILSDAKQVVLGIRMYSSDHEENFPATLEELMPKYCSNRRIFFARMEPGEPPERFIYIPGYKNTDSAGNIVLVSPRPIFGDRVIGMNDGSASVIKESDFQMRIQRQLAGKPLPLGLRVTRSP